MRRSESFLVGLLATALACGSVDAQERPIQASLTDVRDDGVFIDRGRRDGLVSGLLGTVRRAEAEVGRVRIERLADRSGFASIVSGKPQPGDHVTFVLLQPEAGESNTGAAQPGVSPRKGVANEGGENGDEFVPLLAPGQQVQAPTTTHDLIGGHLGFRTTTIRNGEADRTYRYDRVFSRGSWDRIAGSLWSLEWDVDLNRRDGSGYKDSADYQELKGRVDLLAVTHHGEDGFVSFGRLDPLVLPGIGIVDGVQAEQMFSKALRAGFVVGLRPDRRTEGLRTGEIVVFPYAALETGSRETTYGVTTAGVELTWFEGENDRQALHLEQLLYLGDWLRLAFSSEVDAYTGSETQRSGAGFTRVFFSADLWPRDAFSLYTRMHHFERPETLSERDLLSLQDSLEDRLFDAGHNTVAVGAREKAGNEWSFYQEVSQLGGAGTGSDFQGRVGLRKSAVLGVERLSAGLDLFNTVGMDQSGLGGRAWGDWAPADGLDLLAAFDTSRIEFDTLETTTVTSSSISLDLYWLAGERFSVSGGLRHDFGDASSSDTVSLGATWRF